MSAMANQAASGAGDREVPSGWRQRGLILLIALVVRGVAGWIFFGCIDLTNTLLNSEALAAGQHGRMESVPYFPVIGVFTWLGGALNLWTDWPLAFCYKVVPLTCDALIAVLIYDILRARRFALAFWAGLFYALSPVPIIINGLHGQWDSIVLFSLLLAFHIREDFRESGWGDFLFGAFFMFSFLVKPFAIIFAPLFFRPWTTVDRRPVGTWYGLVLAGLIGLFFWNLGLGIPWWVMLALTTAYACVALVALNLGVRLQLPAAGSYARRQLPALAGLVLVAGLALFLFNAFGYSVPAAFQRVLNYSRSGVQIFGLPFARPFSGLPQIFQGRMWILPLIGLILLWYFAGRLGPFQALLAGFGVTLGTAGLNPQYLIWPVPLLLITRRFRLAGLYTVVATGFLLLFYANPYSSYILWENMNTLTALKSCAWLMPATDYGDPNLLDLIRGLGNYALPAIMLFLAALILLPLLGNQATAERPAPGRARLRPWHNLHIWLVLFLVIVVTGGTLISRNHLTPAALAAKLTAKASAYAVEPTARTTIHLDYLGFYPRAGTGSVWNVINLGLLWASVWLAAAVALTLIQPPADEPDRGHPADPQTADGG
jgi:hypothetical protein